jgi:uncharacterized circularly permuted ATP-grasp superfamily protein/uncharacterized alpha-E superfamily protein
MVVRAERPELLAGYARDMAAFDEMCARDGSLRPHWSYLIKSLQGVGNEAMAERRREAVRLLRDDGATFNVYSEPDGLNRPWGLDPVPVQIASDEWATIEAGLIERAELLSLILADLYGPRQLIRRGLLPPEVIYSHQGFLRECDQIPLPQQALSLYAVDLVRCRSGGMAVINDRTQAPSGAGYALENRTVMSRIFPSLFRESHPHRLASFFRGMREGLNALTPQGREEANIVVLTPGVRNEAYFEHVYLANYLGYSLAEGSDLSVRDGVLYLRSLAGMERVDVLLRRVDDLFCDPVELRGDSQLGVPGLLEAVRRGNVALANPIGAGVLENPGLWPFLPGIARHFFGHDLSLPSVDTWWCGQDSECGHVLANLDRMVVRSIDRRIGVRPVFGFLLTAAQREQWCRRIEAQPHLYVGQTWVDLSTTPAFIDDRLQPRRWLLRSYLAARDESYVVMPGGLTRVAQDSDSVVVSNQAGAISKDTWVLASEPEKHESLWPQVEARAKAKPLQESIGGRTAENLFWLGRYAERAEQSTRLLRHVYGRYNEALQEGDGPVRKSLELLLGAVTHLTATYPGFLGEAFAERRKQTEAELYALIADGGRSGTIAMNLSRLLENSVAVRALLSSDTWRVMNLIEDLQRRIQRLPPGSGAVPIQAVLDRLVTTLMGLAGLMHESMGHELSWRFLEIGRRLERTALTGWLLRALAAPVSAPESASLALDSLLASTDTQTVYRRRHRSSLTTSAVLALLLNDEGNPRSVAYQLATINARVLELPGQQRRPLSPEARIAFKAHSLLALADPNALAEPDASGARASLDELLRRVDTLMLGLSDALTQQYFAIGEPLHQLLVTADGSGSVDA